MENFRPNSAGDRRSHPFVHQQNDAAGIPARKPRAYSAHAERAIGAFPGAPVPVTGPEIMSYFQHKGDDLGRSVTQHKPLNKGPHAQASLSTSFADTDPGQRPRIWAPAEVHKPSSNSLSTADIEGAQSKLKSVFPTPPRNTNPVDPRYVLPSSHPLSTDPILQSRLSDPSNSTSATPRNPTQLDDIEGSSPQVLKHSKPQLSNSLDVTDIEGAVVGWKPHFRAHVGVRSRDVGLDVSDINGPSRSLPPRKQDDPLAWTTGTLNNQFSQTVTHTVGVSAARKAKARPSSAAPRLAGGFPEHEFTGLPVFQQARPQDGVTTAPTLGTLNARDMRDQQRVWSALAAMQQKFAAQLDAKIYMAQAERRRLNNVQAHQLRVSVADEHRAARKAADEATAALGTCVMDSQKNVGALYHAWQTRDREASGKLTSAEFGQAMQSLQLQVPPNVLAGLVRGLSDTAGLIPYRELTKVMLRQASKKRQLDSAKRTAPSTDQQSQQPSQHPSGAPPPTGGAAVSMPEFFAHQGLPNQQQQQPSYEPTTIPLAQPSNQHSQGTSSSPPNHQLSADGLKRTTHGHALRPQLSRPASASITGSTFVPTVTAAADPPPAQPAQAASTSAPPPSVPAASNTPAAVPPHPAAATFTAPPAQAHAASFTAPPAQAHAESFTAPPAQAHAASSAAAQAPQPGTGIRTTASLTAALDASSSQQHQHACSELKQAQCLQQQQQQQTQGDAQHAIQENGWQPAFTATSSPVQSGLGTQAMVRQHGQGDNSHLSPAVPPTTSVLLLGNASQLVGAAERAADMRSNGQAQTPQQQQQPLSQLQPHIPHSNQELGRHTLSQHPPAVETRTAEQTSNKATPGTLDHTMAAQQQAATHSTVTARRIATNPLLGESTPSHYSTTGEGNNTRKRSPDLQAVPVWPRNAQEQFEGGDRLQTARRLADGMEQSTSAQGQGRTERPLSARPSSRPPSAWKRSMAAEEALEEAKVDAALEACIVPPGVQILGPEGAKYFTYKGRTYWFAGNEPAHDLATASADYRPLKDGSHIAARAHMKSQPPIRDFDAPLFKGAKLQPSAVQGQKEVNNGLLPAKPSGGSLGATLYHAGGHGTGTFMASPMSTQPKPRTMSARSCRAPPNQPMSSSITSVANSGAGPAMQRLDRVMLRDELRGVRMLC